MLTPGLREACRFRANPKNQPAGVGDGWCSRYRSWARSWAPLENTPLFPDILKHYREVKASVYCWSGVPNTPTTKVVIGGSMRPPMVYGFTR